MRGRAAALAGALALAVAGCGGDDEPTSEAVDLTDGRQVLAASGCLACHQIGSRGSSGPGNSLTGIGTRRTAAEIRAAIVDPRPSPTGTAAMPSYDELPRRALDALVAYLSAQRGDGPGGSACSDGADCG